MIFQTLLNRPGGYTEEFPPFLATFGWTIFAPWPKTWNIRISKIDRKSTCWFWDLEVSDDFPDTLKSTGGLYWGVSTIFSHFWLNYFYAVGKNLKIQFLRKFANCKLGPMGFPFWVQWLKCLFTEISKTHLRETLIQFSLQKTLIWSSKWIFKLFSFPLLQFEKGNR